METTDENGQQSVSSNQQNANNGSNNNKSNKKNKKKNKNRQNNASSTSTNSTQQSSSKPVEFDYSSVDFKKFQGGSQKQQPNPEFKSKFHGKVNVLNYLKKFKRKSVFIYFSFFFYFREKITKRINNSTKC